MQEDRSVIQEEGRHAIRMAFGIRQDYGESSLSAIIDTKSKSGGGGSWKGAATRVHATESMKTGSSKPVLSGNQVLTGFVHRCIKELNPMEQNWVNFRYRMAGQHKLDCGQMFMREYSALYMAGKLEGTRIGTRSIIREMIAWKMQQEARVIPLGAEFESANGTISRQQWHKTYKKHWDLICKDLARVDGSAVFKVGVKICHQN